MPGNGIQNHSQSFGYSQTMRLPLETWQEIFWLASSIEDTDEFTTNARSYNRSLWDGREEENVVKAEMTPAELNTALQTRQNITRVCKAWYSMSIEILYSHIRILPHLWDDLASQRLIDKPQLLSHTKRLTIVPPEYQHHLHGTPVDNLTRTARLCVSLPRLRILDAPGDILLFFPHQSLPDSLSVVIVRGCRDYNFDAAILPVPHDPLHTPWCNIRVLKVDLHSLDPRLKGRLQPHLGDITFVSVEELYFNDGLFRDEGVAHSVLWYVSEQWKFPTLHTLSIRCFDWLDWWGFLEAHSQMLKILSLTTYGYSFSAGDKGRIEFPELEGLYMDDYDIEHTIVAGKATRVGWHGVGCLGGPGETTTDSEKLVSLRHLKSTFNCWLNFPAAITYRITGWHEVLEWLEEQPDVIKRVAEHEEVGGNVEFIHMEEKYSYARESLIYSS